MLPDGVIIEQLNPAAVESLRPMWLALQAHHGSVTPDWSELRAPEDSWKQRRSDYIAWLQEPDAFCLVAYRDRAPVGYALVTVNQGSPTWVMGRFGYIETLSVLPDERGGGIGSALLHAVEDHLATLDVVHVELSVVANNLGARRFYEREGYGEAFVTMQRRSRRTA